MGSYVFKWDHPAHEVYVTHTQDTSHKWETDRLDKVGDAFEKCISFPEMKSVYYCFVIDGASMIEDAAPQRSHYSKTYNVLAQDLLLKDPPWPLRSLSITTPEYPIASGGYPYKPLDFDTHEIRLLKLNWAHLEESAIFCSLEHVSLIDPGPYIALSYCWGDPKITKSVYIGESLVEVTVNLHLALKAVRKFRLKSGSNEVTRLWVDAICINQKDGQERSQQVRNMRQIYSRAEEVIAWVGPTGEELVSDEAIARLAMIQGSADWAHSKHAFNPKIEAILKSTRHDFMAFEKFFSQPYWERVWIIQEITVASNVTILYGGIKLLWDDVAAFLKMQKEIKSNAENHEFAGFASPDHLLQFRELFFTQRTPISLLEALRLSRKTQATDPRDKIFALLGLCYDGSTFVPVPNYKQSLESIVAEMSKAMMIWNKSLDLICLKGNSLLGENTMNIPTWAPNWFRLWEGNMTIQENSLIDRQNKCTFNPILAGSTPGILIVRGNRIGAVTSLTSAMGRNYRDSQISVVRGPWISSTRLLGKQKPNLQNPSLDMTQFYDILWRTLTMSLFAQDNELSEAQTWFKLLWRPEGRGSIHDTRLIEWIDHNAWFKVGAYTLREWSQVNVPAREVNWLGETTYDQAKGGSSNLEAFLEVLREVLGSGMRLACLDAGPSFIAMVHPDARESDKIFNVKGCSIPVVLRRTSEVDICRYMVIGGAYLDDLQKWEAEPELTEELILC